MIINEQSLGILLILYYNRQKIKGKGDRYGI